MTAHQRPLLRLAACAITAGAWVTTFAGPALASQPTTVGSQYGGFTTAASATPLRLEMYEPAIPIPSSPQVELNFSYTTVTGSSGPTATAMASALWPGDAIGNGLPTILATSGLPASLAGGGYPVHVNARYPGQPNSGSQEFLPGQVGRVSAGAQQTSARAGYSSSGQVAGDPSPNGIPSALSQLQAGNLGALGSLLSPPGSSSGTSSNPLGVLSAVISVGGMSSSSVTDYSDASTVRATGTSQVGDVELLGGLVKLEGVTVTSSAVSSLDGGGKAAQKVTYGGLTVQGRSFKLTSDGIEAAGTTKSAPDPTQATTALAKLGITMTFPKPSKTVSGSQVTTTADGPIITIDTQPVLSLLQLNKLPLAQLTNQLPSSASQLKGILQAVLQAHPKIVIKLGEAQSSAQTIAAINLGSGGGGDAPSATGSGGSTSSGTAGPAGVPATNSVSGTPAGATNPGGSVSTPIQTTSALPGLPPLGSVPSLLTLGGLILAAGLGWFFRAAALRALGAGSTCTHGLVTGLPDLRKA